MSRVYWRKTQDRKSFIETVLGIFDKEIDAANSIFLKPNLVSHEPYPTTTHPDTLDVLLSRLSRCDLAVGDAPGADLANIERVISGHPLRQLCDRRGVPFINLYEAGMKREVSARGYEIEVCTIANDYDLVISLPVLKSHFICGITGALKNQFGYVSAADRGRMHRGKKSIHKGIAEVNLMAKPHLFIVDAIETLTRTNEVRHGGQRAELGYMLAGDDPVSVDCYGLELLKTVDQRLEDKEPTDIEHVKFAIEYGLGDTCFELVEI